MTYRLIQKTPGLVRQDKKHKGREGEPGHGVSFLIEFSHK